MASALMSRAARNTVKFLTHLKHASATTPLLLLGSDDEITKNSRHTRVQLEKLSVPKATSFESSFVLRKYTGGLGESETIAAIDILCVDVEKPGELWAPELDELREGSDRNRARSSIKNVLRGLHLASFPTHKALLRHMHGQLAARLDEIEALTPTSAPYGCVLVAKPGKEFAMVLKILDRFMSKLEAHFKVPVFHMTAPHTGKYDDDLMPWGNGCDWQGRVQNLAGFNGLPGYQALLAAAPLYCKRSMAFFEPLFALFPDLYKSVGARSIQTLWCGLADTMDDDFESLLLEPDAAATPFGEHAAPNAFLESLRADKRFPTPAALRDFFVANPDQFNRILHNARPDALEIHDIVQFYFVLLDRIEKHIASKSTAPMVDAD